MPPIKKRCPEPDCGALYDQGPLGCPVCRVRKSRAAQEALVTAKAVARGEVEEVSEVVPAPASPPSPRAAVQTTFLALVTRHNQEGEQLEILGEAVEKLVAAEREPEVAKPDRLFFIRVVRADNHSVMVERVAFATFDERAAFANGWTKGSRFVLEGPAHNLVMEA